MCVATRQAGGGKGEGQLGRGPGEGGLNGEYVPLGWDAMVGSVVREPGASVQGRATSVRGSGSIKPGTSHTRGIKPETSRT
jgi:hypothetical protein